MTPFAFPFRRHPGERDPRRWPPVLASILVRPMSIRAVYREVRDPGGDPREQKIAVRSALLHMAADGLAERCEGGWRATTAGRIAYVEGIAA